MQCAAPKLPPAADSIDALVEAGCSRYGGSALTASRSPSSHIEIPQSPSRVIIVPWAGSTPRFVFTALGFL
jgi:hypothetical protein